MESERPQETESTTILKWLMGVRVLIVTLLLGVSFLLQLDDVRSGGPNPVFSWLIATTYLLTILYAVLFRRVSRYSLFAYVQIGIDLVLETVLVYYTGGVDSPFVPLYMVTIIAASTLLNRRGGILAAGAAAILDGAIIDIQYFRMRSVFAAGSSLSDKETLGLLFTSIVAFFTVAYLSGSLADKLKRARQSLAEKSSGLAQLQAFHENVVQSVSTGLLTTDVNGRVTSLNRAGREITGFTLDEVRAALWWTVLRADDLKDLFSADRPLERSVRIDREGTRKNGTRVQLGMTVSPLRDQSGAFRGSVWVFQDLTRIKQLEDQMKRREWLATIGELAAGMAHEIRNPLAALSGSMQVLRRDLDLDEEYQRLLDIALRETERLNGIISSFLLYARPAPLNRRRCDVNALILETLDLLVNAPDYCSNVAVTTRLQASARWAVVDPDKTRQVFWNLALNAVQAMPEGGELTVVSRETWKPWEPSGIEGSWIEVTFQDTGAGIDSETLEKVFYPFFTTKDRGSGLGLSIVHRIVESHGGQIVAKSEPTRGSVFTVYLPAGPEVTPAEPVAESRLHA